MTKVFAFIGPQGSAKSTTVHRFIGVLLSLGYTSVASIEEIASILAAQGKVQLNEDAGFKDQRLILWEQLIEERKMLDECPQILLCDRSYYDPIAYSYYLVEEGKMTKDQLQILKSVVETYPFRYDEVFYCPPKQIYYEGPGDFTSMSKSFQSRMDSVFRNRILPWLEELGQNVVVFDK